MKPLGSAALLLLLLFVSSCSPSKEGSLNLLPTPPLSGGPAWAVVKEVYARLKESPVQGARDLSHLRRGELFEVSGRDLGSSPAGADKRGLWYRLKAEGAEGWARAEDIDVFATKAQAELAAAKYR